MKVTVWYTVSKNLTKLNHIEDGWVLGMKPQPKNPDFILQTSWEHLEWVKTFRLLIDNKITKK